MKQVIFIFCTLVAFATALRFSNDPITVDTDVILVNQPAKLTCNYVKFRTETVREISWFIAYSGFRSKVRLFDIY